MQKAPTPKDGGLSGASNISYESTGFFRVKGKSNRRGKR